MKTHSLRSTLVLTFLLASFSSAHGADCVGQWQKIPNYKQRMGAPCQALGLDTHKGTCQPGQAYETLCDDAAGGLYRTCQGPTPCGGQIAGGGECNNWDFTYNRPCPEGYVNADCRDHCETLAGDKKCRQWDYIYKQPCPAGYINRDCKGGCEPATPY